MRLVMFSKFLKDKDIAGLAATAKELGLEGYDLCVRDGYVVSPANAREMMPRLVQELGRDGLSVAMVTGPIDLVWPDHAAAAPICAAMSESGVRLLKIGYEFLNPAKGEDYWEKVDHIRRGLEGWVRMAQKYDVRVCLHTHSGEPRYHMGVNCAALMHLLAGFDPKYVGAYLDPGHMAVDGEPFSYGVSMVRKYLAIVALKDVLLFREDRGDEGGEGRQWVTAGKGCVAWSKVFAELVRVGFDGPLTVHGEYRNDGPEDFRAKLKPEVAYFRGKRDEAVGK